MVSIVKSANWFVRSVCLIATALLVVASSQWVLTDAQAGTLPTPKGAIMLTVSGNISNDNGGGEARFDREMLEALELRTLHTNTLYSKGPSVWRGVLMRDLLDLVGAQGNTADFYALDDYRVVVPLSDYYEFDVLLAMEKNGKKLTLRSRGPTRIIYPLDSNEELREKLYAERYVWQIKKIIVK